MKQLTVLPKSDQLLRLEVDKVDEARHIIDTIFESKSLGEIRDELRQWYEAAISSNYPGYESGEERANLFYLYHSVEILVEAAYVLNNQQKH